MGAANPGEKGEGADAPAGRGVGGRGGGAGDVLVGTETGDFVVGTETGGVFKCFFNYYKYAHGSGYWLLGVGGWGLDFNSEHQTLINLFQGKLLHRTVLISDMKVNV